MNISDLIRRLENVVRRGVVCEVDYTEMRCRVQTGDIKTCFLPWMTQRAGEDKTWDAPSMGEQCIVFSESGELTNGTVIFGLYSDANPSPESDPSIKARHYSDGAVISYNVETHTLQAILPEEGRAILTAMGGVTINGDTTINGNFTTNGDATTNGNVQTNGSTAMTGNNTVGGSQLVQGSSYSTGDFSTAGDVKAGDISLREHRTPGIKAGDEISGEPIP